MCLAVLLIVGLIVPNHQQNIMLDQKEAIARFFFFLRLVPLYGLSLLYKAAKPRFLLF